MRPSYNWPKNLFSPTSKFEHNLRFAMLLSLPRGHHNRLRLMHIRPYEPMIKEFVFPLLELSVQMPDQTETIKFRGQYPHLVHCSFRKISIRFNIRVMAKSLLRQDMPSDFEKSPLSWNVIHSVFILDLATGFNTSRKDSCKTWREILRFWI